MPHIHDKIDFTVEVFIVNEDKVLLRKHDKFKIWLSVGGHIELHEDPVEAAIREVKEEVGLDIEIPSSGIINSDTSDYKELIPPRFLNRHKINDTHEHVTLVYFAKAKNINITANSADKSDEHKWFKEEELSDPQYDLRENVLTYAKSALQEMKTFNYQNN